MQGLGIQLGSSTRAAERGIMAQTLNLLKNIHSCTPNATAQHLTQKGNLHCCQAGEGSLLATWWHLHHVRRSSLKSPVASLWARHVCFWGILRSSLALPSQHPSAHIRCYCERRDTKITKYKQQFRVQYEKKLQSDVTVKGQVLMLWLTKACRQFVCLPF